MKLKTIDRKINISGTVWSPNNKICLDDNHALLAQRYNVLRPHQITKDANDRYRMT